MAWKPPMEKSWCSFLSKTDCTHAFWARRQPCFCPWWCFSTSFLKCKSLLSLMAMLQNPPQYGLSQLECWWQVQPWSFAGRNTPSFWTPYALTRHLLLQRQKGFWIWVHSCEARNLCWYCGTAATRWGGGGCFFLDFVFSCLYFFLFFWLLSDSWFLLAFWLLSASGFCWLWHLLGFWLLLLFLAFWLLLTFWYLLAFVGFLVSVGFGFYWCFDSVGHSRYRSVTRNYIEPLALGLRWLKVIFASSSSCCCCFGGGGGSSRGCMPGGGGAVPSSPKQPPSSFWDLYDTLWSLVCFFVVASCCLLWCSSCVVAGALLLLVIFLLCCSWIDSVWDIRLYDIVVFFATWFLTWCCFWLNFVVVVAGRWFCCQMCLEKKQQKGILLKWNGHIEEWSKHDEPLRQ